VRWARRIVSRRRSALIDAAVCVGGVIIRVCRSKSGGEEEGPCLEEGEGKL
jgi:hypothetical protein